MTRRYRNLKNGKPYLLLGEATDCTNQRDGLRVVLYAPEDRPDFLCVREKQEFLAKFEPLDAVAQPPRT